MDMNKATIFFRGEYVPAAEANLNVMTHCVQYGTTVFEGLRAYWSDELHELNVLRMREHYERMMESMKSMRMRSPYSVTELCDITIELLKRNDQRCDMYIRPFTYKTALRLDQSLRDNPDDLCISHCASGQFIQNREGLKVQVSNWCSFRGQGHFSQTQDSKLAFQYRHAKTDAQLAGFDDCIVETEHGFVSAGSAMNLFMVLAGRLVTSPLNRQHHRERNSYRAS